VCQVFKKTLLLLKTFQEFQQYIQTFNSHPADTHLKLLGLEKKNYETEKGQKLKLNFFLETVTQVSTVQS